MYKILFLFFFIYQSVFGYFEFKGVVNQPFYGGTAYLSIVEDCGKKDLFITEDILQDCLISPSGEFIFKGDFLSAENQIYKIHIDHCDQSVSNYKHLLNHCEFSSEVIFIANNSDNIYFPVNNLSQILCNVDQSTNPQSSSIIKLEELEESLLAKLQYAKNDFQRQNIYKSYFKELQKFSDRLNEPLAELYAYYMYASDNTLSADHYLKDLKKSSYYNTLLEKLESTYPNSKYTELYKHKLQRDQYPFIKNKQTVFKVLTYMLLVLLIIALYIIFRLKKRVGVVSKEKTIDYKQVLTPQEQKVFELMKTHSNKEIAGELFVSVSTIKSHINNIYSKLSISSRKEINQFLK